MRRRMTLALTLVASLVAGLLAVAPTVTAAPKRVAPQYEIQVNEYIIPTKVGKIYARIAHPVDSKGKIKEVGYFDVVPQSDSPDFDGSWGVYPFLPSGNIIASGMGQGLFVLKSRY